MSNPRDEAGFTLIEVLAALFVISLAMTQLPVLTGHFVRSMQRTTAHAGAVQLILDRSPERNDVDPGSRPAAGPDQVNLRWQTEAQVHQPCHFDVVGRRCL